MKGPTDRQIRPLLVNLNTHQSLFVSDKRLEPLCSRCMGFYSSLGPFPWYNSIMWLVKVSPFTGCTLNGSDAAFNLHFCNTNCYTDVVLYLYFRSQSAQSRPCLGLRCLYGPAVHMTTLTSMAVRIKDTNMTLISEAPTVWIVKFTMFVEKHLILMKTRHSGPLSRSFLRKTKHTWAETGQLDPQWTHVVERLLGVSWWPS